MVAGTRMWESEMFTEDQMVARENKTAAQQTWQNLQDYFPEKWLEQRQYLQATAKQLRFRMQPLQHKSWQQQRKKARPPR